MSSRQAIVEKKRKVQEKFEAERLAAESTANINPLSDGEWVEKDKGPEQSLGSTSLEITGNAHPNQVRTEDVPRSHKRHRVLGDVIETYVPKWDILSTDTGACAAPDAEREVVPDLFRGMMLPADSPAYVAADPLTACTELMALMSMVRVLFLLTFCQIIYFRFVLYCYSFGF